MLGEKEKEEKRENKRCEVRCGEIECRGVIVKELERLTYPAAHRVKKAIPVSVR